MTDPVAGEGSSSANPQRIVKYWDSALLAGPESSTSHADPNLSVLDNHIENAVLARLLGSWAPRTKDPWLDAGAGYGRFTTTLSSAASGGQIILLEGAERIFSEMRSRWQQEAGVQCVHGIFEDYAPAAPLGLILASGILYLYDDSGVRAFLSRARSLLGDGGVVLLREFVSEPPTRLTSKYVEGASCHYRSRSDWSAFAQGAGMDLVRAVRSRPPMPVLRHPRVRRVLAATGLGRILRLPIVADRCLRRADLTIRGGAIQTAFLVLRVQ